MDPVIHRFSSHCGRLELAARLFDHAGSGTSPVPLLMMHGLTRNSRDFEPLADILAPHYRLIVPDQRGRGLSARDPDPANYRIDLYMQDMFSLLDGLGIEKVAIIGTSMGGLMGMGMAAMRPSAITALVLNDIGPALEPEGLARIQGYVGDAGPAPDWESAAQRCAAINGPAFPRYGPDQWIAFARRTWVETARGIELDYDPAIAASIAPSSEGTPAPTIPPALWPLWQALDALPVLTVRGALSDLLSQATVEEMARTHAGPFAFAQVPDVGHAPILDEPEARDAIVRFLAEA